MLSCRTFLNLYLTLHDLDLTSKWMKQTTMHNSQYVCLSIKEESSVHVKTKCMTQWRFTNFPCMTSKTFLWVSTCAHEDYNSLHCNTITLSCMTSCRGRLSSHAWHNHIISLSPPRLLPSFHPLRAAQMGCGEGGGRDRCVWGPTCLSRQQYTGPWLTSSVR